MSANVGALQVTVEANAQPTAQGMAQIVNVVEGNVRRINTAAGNASNNIANIGRAGRSIGRIKGAEEAAASIDKVGHSSTAARRELLVLAHEASQGNWKRFGGSLLVLGERMDLMGKIMSPVGVAVGVAAAAVGFFAIEAIKGAVEAEHFAKSLAMTGNYAGQTAASFQVMTKRIAEDAGVTVGHAREVTQALISTGRVSGESLESVSRAAARYADATGATAEETAKEFAKMTEAPLKWATEANKQFHFMDGALYDYVQRLEQTGQKEAAARAVSEAYYNHLGGTAVANLNALGRGWMSLSRAIDQAKESLKHIGEGETDAEKAVATQLRIAQGQAELAANPNAKGAAADAMRKGLETNTKALTNLAKKQIRDSENALLAEQKARHNDRVVEAKEFYSHFVEAHKQGQALLEEKKAEIARNFTDAGHPEAIAAAQALIEKEFAHGKGNGVERAETLQQLQPLQAQITAEEKLLAYRERVLAQYHKADLISDEGYYDTRKTVIEAAQKRIEKLYDEEIAVAEKQASRVKDARAKIEATTKVNELRDQKQAALLQSSEALAQADFENAQASEAYKNSLVKLNAELDKLRHNTANSATADFNRTHEGLIKQATLKGDASGLGTIDAARNATQAQADMNTLKERATLIENALKQAEAETALQVATGQETQVQGMQEVSDKRKQAVQDLQAIADQMQVIADKSGFADLKDQAAQFTLTVGQIKASTDVLGKTVTDTMSGAFANSLLAVQNRTKSLKQAFLDMANSIEQALLRIVDNDIAQMLFNGSAGSSASSGGGLFGKLVGLAVTAFGGGGGVDGAVTSDQLSAPDWSNMPGRAAGGPVTPNSMYEVNERGPELLTYANRTFLMMGDKGGKVTPLSSGAGGGSPVFNMNIAVPAGTTRQSAQQQAAEIMRHAQIAQARNA